MRELWATKDHGEREDEEAERLVRPLPKFKPPRKDRRREEMETDRDPDVDADPDLKGDPDLSLNYKNVGGSVDPRRVAYRFLIRRALDSDKVLVKNKETGKETEIKKETLKEEGQKYEVLKPGEKEPAKEEAPKDTSAPKQQEKDAPKPGASTDDQLRQDISELHERAKEDVGLAGILKTLGNETSPLAGAAKRQPGVPLKQLFPKSEFPDSMKTLGDLAKGIQLVPKASPGKSQSKPKAPAENAPAQQQTEKALSDAEKSLPPDIAKQLHPLFEQLGKNLVDAIQKGLSAGKPEAPAAEKPEVPPSAEKKPETPPAEKPAEPKEKPPAKKPKPAPTEKWPGRRQPTPKEVQQAQDLIAKELPGRVAVGMMDLHPDDAKALVEQYKGMKNLGAFKDEKEAYSKLEKISEHFTLDPKKVAPPKTWKNNKGKEVPFNELDPDEQKDAERQHQAQVVAYSIATRDRAIKTFTSKGLPSSVAAHAVDLTLRKPPVPKSPEEAVKQQEEHAAKVKEAAINQFIASVGDPKGEKPEAMSDQERKKALSALQTMPKDAQAIAVAHFAADDYHHAIRKYLSEDSDPDVMISEHDSPGKIVSKINRALDELGARAADYPKDVKDSLPDASRVFREKALARLKEVDPSAFEKVNEHYSRKKYEKYEAQIPKFHKEVDRFQKDQADFTKKWDKWEAKRTKAEEKHDAQSMKEEQDSPGYRTTSKPFKFEEAPPEPPVPPKEPDLPDGYLDWKAEKPDSARDARKKITDIEKRLQAPDVEEESDEDTLKKMKSPAKRVLDRFRGPKKEKSDEETDADKVKSPAKRILDKFRRKKQGSLSPYSSYDFRKLTMGTLPTNDHGSREAVYHGVTPYPAGHDGIAPYTKWTQAHQRELGDADSTTILAAAREWLKSTVLSSAIEGMVPDARYRAALDLAIRDVDNGKYSGAINPVLYNELLAKLAGEPTAEPLVTIREASTPMKLASEVRRAAAEVAETNPVLAYDLLELADQMSVEATPVQALPAAPVKQASVDDTYESLRASIIRTASSNPTAKQALLPVLRLIRTQDEVRALRCASSRNE